VARRTRHKLLALLPVLALATLSAACGTANDNPGGGGAPNNNTSAIPTVAKDDKLAALLPDVDLGKAIGQKLGVELTFENSAFDGIIPGLKAGRYEAAMSSFTINQERLAEVDMVSYFSAGTSGAVVKGNPENLTLDTLCGKNVAVQKGTVQVEDLDARSAKCKADGKPEITVQQFQNQTDANLALNSKRVAAMLADSPVVDYAIKKSEGSIEQVGQVYDTAPYGIILPKAKGDYAKAVQGAIQALIDDGTYKKILEKWGVQQGGVTKSEVNPKPAG
jgi:polar amino acid transport system substrate-binding protein